MDNTLIVSQNNLLPQKVKVDFNVIELPLFSQNNKLKTNMGAVYTIDKKRNIAVEVIPGAGLTIPNDFDQRVYLALVQIAIEFKEKHKFEQIPNKIYTTYYEIFVKLKMSMRGEINDRIYKSLRKLHATVYNLWNCFYDAKAGIKNGVYTSNFIHSIEVIPTDSKGAQEAMNYIGVTKSSNVISLELNSFFLDNIIHKKGNLIHSFNELITLEDPIARNIYLYCDKNRFWYGKKHFNTDKKIRITAKRLASVIPLNFKMNAVSVTINRIRKALEFLCKNDMIVEFVEYKGKPLSETYYEVSFGWSREDKEYVLTGRENFEISTVDEIEANSDKSTITIEETKEVDFSTGAITKITTNNVIDVESIIIEEVEIHENIIGIIEPILSKITDETKKLLNEYYLAKGKVCIEASIEYANTKAKTNYNKYLQDTLKNEWALSLIEKYKNREAKQQKEAQKVNTEIYKKKQEEQQEQINQQLIENEYYKLDSLVQDKYEIHANSVLQNHGVKLIQIFGESLKDKLKFCVYAVSTDKNYDKTIELFISNMYKINLDIH
ncbi:MAG: hypothetical protein QG673_1437 [Pseudomonadota bacterium]|nr:hypothetical protein [Pseudomonadota bacterium]